MKKALLVFLSLPFFAAAQSTGVKVEQRQVSAHWKVDPRSFKEDFSVNIKQVEAPLPGGDLKRAEMDSLKRIMAQKYPRQAAYAADRGGERSGDTLTVASGFTPDFFLTQSPMVGGTPNDNTLAISNGGNLITSWNSQLWAYDVVADTYLFSLPAKHPSFFQFLNSYNDTVFQLSFPFDPKLLYDPIRDKFIMLFLTGREPSNSGTVVCFSSTSDPKDPWNAYFLDGNPLSYDTWTDYPQIAISENSFYLTLNQLYPDSGWVEGFAETVMWQMDLDEAFAGDPNVTTKFWTGFEFGGKNIRYLHPAKSHMGPEGDTLYLLANRPFVETNDTFFLVRVTGDAHSTNQDIDIQVLPSSLRYGHPPYALQSGGNQEFWTNDARVLGAVRMQDALHFTGNTIDTTTGKASIYHGVIADLNSPQVTGTIFSDPDKELGFPNIEFIGVTRTDRDVVIFADHTGAQVHAGNSMIYVDNNGNYGPIQTVVSGESYVDALQSPQERWGDYTGIQRKFNETAKVWVAGYWGFGNQRPGTYVSEIASPKHGPNQVAEVLTKPRVHVFPNPSAEWVLFEFELSDATNASLVLRDLSGRHVRTLGNTSLASGKHKLRFDAASLAIGTYVVSLVSADQVLWTERFVRP